MFRWMWLALAMIVTHTQAFLFGGGARALTLARANGPDAPARTSACPCMACRQNLKKEKRLRNRINAFRFKKSAAPTRFYRNHAADDAKNANEDNEVYSLIFTHSAAAAAAEQAEK